MSRITANNNEQVIYAARTDVGMKRPQNQDSFDTEVGDLSTWSKQGYRFLVADGMGAHAAGELASKLAVEEFRRIYESQDQDDHKVAIKQALKEANAHIHGRGQADPQLFNMGTTCSALFLLPQGALIGHVGDSRIYRCREGRIQQLTFDHSLVWEMRAAGQISGDANAATVPKNVITRCLGPHAEVDIDVEGYFSVHKGDTFLLCSDGLTGRIIDEEIGAIIRFLEPEVAVSFLIDLANLRGGTDNITVIVASVTGDDLVAEGDVSEVRKRKSGTHPGWWFLAAIGLIAGLVGTQPVVPEMYRLSVMVAGAATFLFGAVGALAHWVWLRRGRANSRLPTSPYVTANAHVNPNFINGICATLDAMAVAFPELPISQELTEMRELAMRESGPQSDEVSRQICTKFAEIARQLRDKV